MRRKLLSFSFFAFSFFSFAQDGNFITINGNRINSTDDFRKLKSAYSKEKMISARKKSTEDPVLIVQFKKPLSKNEQKSLSQKGINLLSYFSDNAYYARLTPGFYEKNVNNSDIKTIFVLKPEHKIASEIVENDIPTYAKEGELLDLVITYHKDGTKKRLDEDFRNIGLKNFRINEDFNQVFCKLSKQKILELVELGIIQNVELAPAPAVLENNPGRTSHKVNVLSSNLNGLGYGLTGNGVKIGIWDGNVEPHKDATNRLFTREYESASTHGSHVFGTMAGAGIIDPLAKGMAPKATVYAWNFNVQSNGLKVYEERLLSANNDGIELTQNSYGVNLDKGYSTTRYDVSDRGDDEVMVRKNYLLTMYSNGNAQSANLAAGGFYTSTKNSKNALHVAANDPNESISNYSSFGPTADGRLVPQISGIGSDVYSMSYNNSYEVMSGTSMATPGVTGTVALLYERYKNKFGQRPLGSLMKAIVCNTADELGNVGPDYKYGYGKINGLRAVQAIDENRFYTASIANGVDNQKVITVPTGTKQLKVMLCYTDLPGVPGTNSILVNNLDLKVLRNGQIYLPWVLNPSMPNNPATKGIDDLNNIEQVTIDNPEPGDYTIIINGKNIPLDSQEFSVAYDYIKPEFKLTYPIGNEKLIPGTKEFIRWDYVGEAKPFVLEYSNDGGNNYKQIAELPTEARTYLWTVPNEVGTNFKIRILSGGKVVSSKQVFTLMPRPENFKSETVTNCGTTDFKLTWDVIPNAKYEILKLSANGEDFEVIAETPTNEYAINTTNKDVYTVRAISLTTNAVSERAIAIILNPLNSKELTAVSLPYKEDFETLSPSNITLTSNPTGKADITYATPKGRNGIVFSSNGVAGATPWVASSVLGFGDTSTTNAFKDNPTYIKKATFCEFDATALAGKKIRLKYDVRYENPNFSSNKIFLRVLVNGTELVSDQGYKFITGMAGSGSPIYDLSAYAGGKINLVFETAMDDSDVNTTSKKTSTLSLDNIMLYEATDDLGISFANTSISTLSSTSTAVKVSVSLLNYSANEISNIPVSYTINGGAPINEVIAGPIAPMGRFSYDFTTTQNMSALGKYAIVVKANMVGDTNPANNTYSFNRTNNGSDIAISSSKLVHTGCDISFTDDGGRFDDYKSIPVPAAAKKATFKPAIAGKKIKVDFTSFNLEDRYDFLKIYNGPDEKSPLIASYTGNTIPASITSSATNGELTFEFVPDDAVAESGWVANITCVDYVPFVDAGITSIIKPEILGKKSANTTITIAVKNYSSDTRNNLPVFYQINGGPKVEEVIASINGFEEKEYTFTTPVDLSTNPDEKFAYVINAGINEVDTNLTNNKKEKKVYNRYSLPQNVNTDGYAITNLNWSTFSNASGVTGYSDFKNLSIPVFKTKTYYPNVTISKADLPLTRSLTLSTGVFTIMVIDLNNDGNFSDEYYAGKYWVNTEANEASLASTRTTHYFKNVEKNTVGVAIPSDVPTGNHAVRFIHMFRDKAESFNVVLGPTKDGLTTSRNDFEIEEYTLNVQELPTADVELVEILDLRPRLNNTSVVTVKLRNNSSVALKNFDIAYKINNGAEVKQTITADVNPASEAIVSFTTEADLRAIQEYTIEAYTQLVGDQNISNDKKVLTIKHVAQNIPNKVANFDGNDDVLITKTNPLFELGNGFTFETWINQKTPAPSFGRFFDKGSIVAFINNNAGHSLYKENSLIISVTKDSGSFALNTETNTIKLNEWMHIAVTASKTNQYKVYINGVEVPARLVSGTVGAPKANNTSPLLIGNNLALTRGFNGNIDEVRVWNTERSAADIINNQNTKFVGNEAGLLCYLPIAETEEVFTYDKSALDNTAIAINTGTNFFETPKLLRNFNLVGQLKNVYNEADKSFTFHVSDTFDLTKAVFDFTTNMFSNALINNVVQVSGVTENNVAIEFVLTIQGTGLNAELSENYRIKINKGLNTESKLISYKFLTTDNNDLGQNLETAINGVNVVGRAGNVNLSNLIATFETSPKATVFVDGVKQLNNKTVALSYEGQSVIVCVVAENTLSKTYYEINIERTLSNDSFENEIMAVYPNPVTEGEMISLSKEGEVVLYDLIGKKVIESKEKINKINSSGLKPGTYLLEVTTDAKNKIRKKIVIK
ncbi:T9SS C-terminal target domain-containing protein [Flavobacterium columnare]|uniref:T9SS C-terminal target domain-containing protein n=1 Tax=Flavobacterium columnare TaxID=996 RepID=A0A437UAY7_9FLAO|nr:S8 family serine peptidase [Flavobacterium columnare]RVU90773.1 T9SS C-terminal target domain-containing protein [Flavobacterium columnare]